MVSSDEESDNDSTPSPAQMQSNKSQEIREREQHQYSHLMIATIKSWLSKQSMAIAMFLLLVTMCRLENGVVKGDLPIRKSKTIRSHT
jgi:hypothetical protein